MSKYPIYNQKESIADKLATVFMWLIVISIVAFIIGINLYVLIRYGGKPIDEVPSWVLWFWFGGNKGRR